MEIILAFRMKTILRSGKRKAKQSLHRLSQIYFKFAGSKVECNICHFKTNRFGSDSWHPHTICQSCGSQVRQRLLMAALTDLEWVNSKSLLQGKKVLHFAPEQMLQKFIKQNSAAYETADFLTEGYRYNSIDHVLDISSMQEIADASFDCLIACDVLEHVPDHLLAIIEINRVLKVGGSCILTVPQKDLLKTTFEDPSITDPEMREKVFGQFDHLRIYGDDFPDILRAYGFDVTVVSEENFNPEQVEKFVLFPPKLSKHPLATNYRKVFFGRKK